MVCLNRRGLLSYVSIYQSKPENKVFKKTDFFVVVVDGITLP